VSKVLVVANETVGAKELLDELRRIEDSKSSDYFVMVPAHPVDDPDAGGLASFTTPWNQEGAIGEAERRLTETLSILKGDGLHATGEVGDMVPSRAIDDALLIFDADTIVISTFPQERSRWLRKSLVEKTRSAHPDKEVIHIVSATVTSSPPPADEAA
jgi:GABA permease